MQKALSIAFLLYATLNLTGSDINETFAANKQTSPLLVAKVALTGQTAAIPPTRIFTPRTSGLFRIAPYMAVTSPGQGGGYWSLTLHYTDEAGAEQIGEIGENNNALPPYAWAQALNGSPLVFRAVAGKPVSYSVDAGASPSGTYELFITVEKLMTP